MFIETEVTPNPATIKFIPHEPLAPEGQNFNFQAGDSCGAAPLAQRLFAIPGVIGVFIAPDFVSVTKDDACAWDSLKPVVLAALMDHLMSGEPAIVAIAKTEKANGAEIDSEIVAQIVELIETRVRPVVAQDGGDIIFSRFEEGIVYLEMQGACAGCPSASLTLKNGIETMLRHYIPEVVEVRAA